MQDATSHFSGLWHCPVVSLVQDSTPQPDLASINGKTQWPTTRERHCEKVAQTDLGTKCDFGLVFQWDLVCERRGLNQATATFFFIGVTTGAVIFGYLSDRFDPFQAVPPGLHFHDETYTTL